MSEEYILMDSKETADFIGTFFSVFQGRYGLRKSLANFAIKEGFSEDRIYIFFKTDLDDYDQTKIPKILDDEHVLLEYESDVDELEYAYLDFPTFYEYLAKEITEIVRAHRKDSDLLDFLAEIKENLINEVKAETVQESIEHELVTSDNQGGDLKEKKQSNFDKKIMNEEVVAICASYQADHLDELFDSMIAFVNHYQDQFSKYMVEEYVSVMQTFKAKDYILGHTDKDLENIFSYHWSVASQGGASVAENCREIGLYISDMSSYVLDEWCPSCHECKLELCSSYDRKQVIKFCDKCAAAFIDDQPMEITHGYAPANKRQVMAYLKQQNK